MIWCRSMVCLLQHFGVAMPFMKSESSLVYNYVSVREIVIPQSSLGISTPLVNVYCRKAFCMSPVTQYGCMRFLRTISNTLRDSCSGFRFAQQSYTILILVVSDSSLIRGWHVMYILSSSFRRNRFQNTFCYLFLHNLMIFFQFSYFL